MKGLSGLKISIVGLALSVCLSDELVAQNRSVMIMLSPPQLAGMSFLFDDCGEPARGERFRRDFLDAANLCKTKLPDTVRMADRIRAEIDYARVNARQGPSAKGHAIYSQKPPAFWSLLEGTEKSLQLWRSGTMTDEEIAHEICGRGN